MTDLAESFPVATKKKIAVRIIDVDEKPVMIRSESALVQLDPTEKNEIHIVNAVTSGSEIKVPIPKATTLKSERKLSDRSGASFHPPQRVNIYSNDLFEKIVYYATKEDIDWIIQQNVTRMFNKLTIEDLQNFFVAAEHIVEDQIVENPSLPLIQTILGNKKLPVDIADNLYEYWCNKPKICASVIKKMEFPPEHFKLRQDAIKYQATLNKQRKQMSELDYLEFLKGKMNDISNEKKIAQATLVEQIQKQNEATIFIRRLVRKSRISIAVGTAFLFEPKLLDNSYHLEEAREKMMMLPLPPTSPTFLQWCTQQKI